MTPAHPDWEAPVRDSFAAQGMMHTLKAELVTVTPGSVVIAAPIRAATTQQHGYAHAGLGWTIGDSAAGFSAMTLVPAGAGVLTVEMKINLMTPAEGIRLLAEGRVLRAGKRIMTVASEVFAEAAGSRIHVATMLGTMLVIEPRS